MRIAYYDGKRVPIDEYKDSMYYGIICAEGHPLVAKRGAIRIHHYAHKNTQPSCCCGDNKGDWHMEWQNRVCKDAQEVRMVGPTSKIHVADIMCGKYVVEIQHSPMAVSIMKEREGFYTGLGYTLVWVFDTSGWEYTKIGTMGIRKGSRGQEHPLWGSYDGQKVVKVLDFCKQHLLVVERQQGPSIYGTFINMDEFHQRYFGDKAMPGADMRPFHHLI